MMKRRLTRQELCRGDAWTEIDNEVSEYDLRHWHECDEFCFADYWDKQVDLRQWFEAWHNPVL